MNAKEFKIKNISVALSLMGAIGFSFLSLFSCDTKLNGCPSDPYEDFCMRQIVFQIYNSDSTEKFLAINSWRYDNDTVKIFNEVWEEATYSIDINGDVYLNLSENQELSVDETINRTFFIYLEKEDVDTIQFEYSLYYECDYYQLVYFKVFYNHTEHQATPGCGPRFIVYKK